MIRRAGNVEVGAFGRLLTTLRGREPRPMVEAAEGATTPEPLRRKDRAGEATLNGAAALRAARTEGAWTTHGPPAPRKAA